MRSWRLLFIGDILWGALGAGLRFVACAPLIHRFHAPTAQAALSFFRHHRRRPRPAGLQVLADKAFTLVAGAVVAFAALAAYHNSFSGPFIFDDLPSIVDNPTIRHLRSGLSLHGSETTVGRPVFNLTFALNYALGGMNVWGYHAVNLLVHTLAGLVSFRPREANIAGSLGLSKRFGARDALPLACAQCGRYVQIRVVHPLQTEAVTYISQRAESLMGLFYLLTLYCFVRSASRQK